VVIKQHLNKLKNVLAPSLKSPYPTKNIPPTTASNNDNDATIITSNISAMQVHTPHHALGMLVGPLLAIADTGATSLYLTKGAPCLNKHRATTPISVTLPDSRKIFSSHICDVAIPGLPTVLTGHIIPDMTTASLLGIRILCKAGYKVIFDNKNCQVIFEDNVILTGYKDPVSNLWMLLMLRSVPMRTSFDAQHQSAIGPCMIDAPREVAAFSYHCTLKENNVKFMHQSLCNPPKLSLLTVICCGFLRGAPHLSTHAVTKYLPPSPATSKGHMKRPRQGICSTTLKTPRLGVPVTVPDPVMPNLEKSSNDNDNDDSRNTSHFNLIDDINDHSMANVFCFGAFADKISGVVYDDCTGKFPYMSLDGNVVFFVMYHYKTNAILATPIPSLNSSSILDSYKNNFEYLIAKGYQPKLNVMDNQATKVIKAYLAPQNVMLQLVEPHNHHVNAAERAIQTFKNCFIGALGTTDAVFPIQLWDKLTPQVRDSINLLWRSRVNPNHSAYKALEGPYNWNRYPMAPLGTKAIIYEDSDTRASWAPYGLDAWFLGPSKDHYCCHLYFVPETRGYCVSGSTNLFPQHCSAPLYSVDTHVKELSKKLQDTFPKAT
jgi:hypothetical protein